MATADKALDKLLKVVEKTEPLSTKGFRLFVLNTDYMTWNEEYPYRKSLSSLLKSHEFTIRESMEDGLKMLETTYIDPQTEEKVRVLLYSILTDEGLLLSVTGAPSSCLEHVIEPLVHEPRVYYMWLPPFLIEKIASDLTKEYPQARVTYFVAKRTGRYNERTVIRPHVERTLIYHGADGEQTFHELAIPYGLFLETIGISIEGVTDLRMRTKGIFSLRNIQSKSFLEKFFFNYALGLIKKALEIKAAVRSSKNESIGIRMAKKELKIPILVPLIIKFSKQLEYETALIIMQSMEERQFSLYNTVLAKGSVMIDSMVIDKNKQSLFAVNINSERIAIAPHLLESVDSLIRFYQLIVETFDPKAICVYSYSE
ncbi:MAG: hypothetical protein FGF48_07320 [Candidatus Brockarchaeota archaeon]|nr:hypothetical protein [Candidatus Brockarchaeota archaeon]